MAIGAALSIASASAQDTLRVSVDSSGVQGDDDSFWAPRVSADGWVVVFNSFARNLVSGDGNGAWDIFVHDRATGITERMSVDSSGAEANSHSFFPSLSADGQVVAFASDATNLVAGDANLRTDVFVHDRSTGATERVSVDSSGAEANDWSHWPSISSNGQFVAFESAASNLVSGDRNGVWDVFVHDRATGITERVSVDSSGAEANGYSMLPALSADGQIVAFVSNASNLVGGDTNGAYDVFIHDRATGITERVSVDSSGAEGNADSGIFDPPSISGDGQVVAFESAADNLVAGDTNGFTDVFVRDRTQGITERVSVQTSGAQGLDFSAWPASRPTDDSWRSRAKRRTSSPTTPTRRRTSSSAIARRPPRSG